MKNTEIFLDHTPGVRALPPALLAFCLAGCFSSSDKQDAATPDAALDSARRHEMRADAPAKPDLPADTTLPDRPGPDVLPPDLPPPDKPGPDAALQDQSLPDMAQPDAAIPGTHHGPCYPNKTCNTGLSCLSGLCLKTWAVAAGGSQHETVYAMARDKSGNLYLAGRFNAKATFGTFSLTPATHDKYDIFVAKMDSAGTFLWATSMGAANSHDSGDGISVNTAGEVVVTGRFGGKATFGSTTLTAVGVVDMFVAKLAASGKVLWA